MRPWFDQATAPLLVMILTEGSFSGDASLFPNLRTMKANMGSTDRVIRTLLAVVIGVLYFTDTIPGNVGIVLLVLAVVFLLTSFISFCPLYAPFGINTCSKK